MAKKQRRVKRVYHSAKTKITSGSKKAAKILATKKKILLFMILLLVLLLMINAGKISFTLNVG